MGEMDCGQMWPAEQGDKGCLRRAELSQAFGPGRRAMRTMPLEGGCGSYVVGGSDQG